MLVATSLPLTRGFLRLSRASISTAIIDSRGSPTAAHYYRKRPPKPAQSPSRQQQHDGQGDLPEGAYL